MVGEKCHLSWEELRQLVLNAYLDIPAEVSRRKQVHEEVRIYGVPRGGVYIALILQGIIRSFGYSRVVVEEKLNRHFPVHFVVDDLIDSGVTMERVSKEIESISSLWPDPVSFIVPIDKRSENCPKKFRESWISFPWDRQGIGQDTEDTVQDNVRRILQFIGEAPDREGLKDTPRRVIKALKEMTSGQNYTDQMWSELCTTFSAEQYDEVIVVRDIPFSSLCEHHLMPFSGTADIGYLPGKKIIGLSKIPRILEILSKRLQVQERLTSQVTETLNRFIAPRGAGCIIRATHSCMSCRGVEKVGASMTTSSLTGLFRDNSTVRQEFLVLAVR